MTGKPISAGGCQYGGGISENVIERYLIKNLFPLLAKYEAEITCKVNESVMDPERRMKNINAKLTRLKDLYVDGLIDKDTYKADFIKLQQELNEMLAAQKKQITRSAVMDRIISDSDFLATYANLSRAQQRELWQSLIKRITFTRRPEDRRKPYTEFQIEFI